MAVVSLYGSCYYLSWREMSNSRVALELSEATRDLFFIVRPVPLTKFWNERLPIFLADGIRAL